MKKFVLRGQESNTRFIWAHKSLREVVKYFESMFWEIRQSRQVVKWNLLLLLLLLLLLFCFCFFYFDFI